MYRIFSILLYLTLTVYVTSSCNNEDDIGPFSLGNTKGTCDVEAKVFDLNSENLNLHFYDGFTQITFTNEAGLEKKFDINDQALITEDGLFTSNDTLVYCYEIESKSTQLSSDDGLEFTILTESKPYFADFISLQSADVRKIFYEDTSNEKVDRRMVFRKVLDFKDYPPPLYETTVSISSQFFIDREFRDVEITNFNTPIVVLYYNDELGILAYRDENNTLWQFTSKL